MVRSGTCIGLRLNEFVNIWDIDCEGKIRVKMTPKFLSYENGE